LSVFPTVFNDLPRWIQRDITRLSDTRRGTFVRFLRELKLRGASPWTVIGYVKAVRTLGFDGKPYEQLTGEDLMAWMEHINSAGWDAETVNTSRKWVKAFLRWVHGCKSVKDPTPEPLRCIRGLRTKRELPKVVLTRGEIRRLIDACDNQRDRALVFAVYESGARTHEILNARIGDVEFDQFGAMLRVRGKTGDRRIRLVESVPDLRLWISMHPQKDVKTTLWPKLKRGGALAICGFQVLLRRLARRAGISKHVHPYLLRHSRATHLANVLTEAQMREFFGWTRLSDMPEVYVHLSGRDVDDTLLKHYGIKVETPTQDLLEPKKCPWCQTLNSPSARFCQSCNAPLDSTSAMEATEKQRGREKLVERFIERILQEAPSVSESILRDMWRELAQFAE